MDFKRLAYQFFHFHSKQWEEHWQNKALNEVNLEFLFRDNIFSKRSLKVEFPRELRAAIAQYEKIQREESANNILVLADSDPRYPQSIFQYLPPEWRPSFLFLRGPSHLDEKENIALVGTRNPSLFGIEQAKNFSAFFTSQNIRVVSGLARGIDSICHEVNLSCGTIAVLGADVLDIYPYENQKLAAAILRHSGALLSPFPLHQVPLPHNFPIRNRLISALGFGTIVIEGSEKSGASITGNLTLEMGKTVVALSQDFRSDFGRGAIGLQESGAVFVRSEEEALQALFMRGGGRATTGQPKASVKVFQFREFQQMHKCSIPQALALLEESLLNGSIKRIGFDRYQANMPSR